MGSWSIEARLDGRFDLRLHQPSFLMEHVGQPFQQQPTDRVVLFNTGAAQKYVEAIRTELPLLDKSQPMAWDTI